MEFCVVAADALTGQAKYFDKGNIRQDDYDIFKATPHNSRWLLKRESACPFPSELPATRRHNKNP